MASAKKDEGDDCNCSKSETDETDLGRCASGKQARFDGEHFGLGEAAALCGGTGGTD